LSRARRSLCVSSNRSAFEIASNNHAIAAHGLFAKSFSRLRLNRLSVHRT
jgi:hypothetical protein